MNSHPVTDRTQWLAQRMALLEQEKAMTRAKDELAAARRALPWVRVEKPYSFETARGPKTLAELFGQNSQLLVYHFMFRPEAERGCAHCAFWADHFDGSLPHLAQRDVTFVAISRAPLAKLETFKRRLDWGFDWASSGEGDFNYDFGASFRPSEREAGTARYNYAPLGTGMPPDMPGFSTFYRDAAGDVFHTYSTFGRGIEGANVTYQLLDLLPKGRNEVAGQPMNWVRLHDEYARTP